MGSLGHGMSVIEFNYLTQPECPPLTWNPMIKGNYACLIQGASKELSNAIYIYMLYFVVLAMPCLHFSSMLAISLWFSPTTPLFRVIIPHIFHICFLFLLRHIYFVEEIVACDLFSF